MAARRAGSRGVARVAAQRTGFRIAGTRARVVLVYQRFGSAAHDRGGAVRQRVVFGRASFASKKTATDAIREVLYRYPTGATIGDNDAVFIAALLTLHPEAELKIGAGIASVQIEQNGPTRGFWITRVDGSRTDFSFLACLTPPTPASNARDGFRSAVQDQVRSFRASHPCDVCAVTGAPISRENCHIDHVIPFASLVDAYLSWRGLVIVDVKVNVTEDGSTLTAIADDEIREGWQAYHAKNAKLRAVSARANLSLLRKRAL